MNEECKSCPLMNCPYIKNTNDSNGLTMEIINSIQRNNNPICFHCGIPYLPDKKYCSDIHTTWKPDCNCINKPGIRIVTGKFVMEDIEYGH